MDGGGRTGLSSPHRSRDRYAVDAADSTSGRAPDTPRNRREGARRAFGRPLRAQHRLERAGIVASFDDDFLGVGPGQLAAEGDAGASPPEQGPDGVAECEPETCVEQLRLSATHARVMT